MPRNGHKVADKFFLFSVAEMFVLAWKRYGVQTSLTEYKFILLFYKQDIDNTLLIHSYNY